MTDDQYAEIHAQLAANEIEHQEMKRRLDNHSEAIKKQSEILVLLERQSSAIERMGHALDRVEKPLTALTGAWRRWKKNPQKSGRKRPGKS